MDTQSPDHNATLVLFARGVISRFECWPTLRLAVDQSWGGPDSSSKRLWVSSVIVDEFDLSEGSELPDDIYIEDMLLQIMADEFDTIIEDGSAETVAKDIIKLWLDVKEGRGEEVVRLWEEKALQYRNKTVLSQEVKNEDEEYSTDEEEDGDDDDEAPQLLPPPELEKNEQAEVDDEGFTLVKGKSRHR